jgi:hypothetical protein
MMENWTNGEKERKWEREGEREKERERYGLEVLSLAESKNDICYYSGKPESEKRAHGVGRKTKPSIINEWLSMLRFWTSAYYSFT